MKSVKFFGMMMAVLAMIFTSCSKSDDNGGGSSSDDVTVTLDQTSIKIGVGDSQKLTATVTPSGTVAWSSADPAIAMVTNGIVIGVAEGSTVITAKSGNAQATCDVTVSKGSNIYDAFPCMQGSDYYPFVLSQGARDYLNGKGVKITWLGANGAGVVGGLVQNSQNFWSWETTLGGGTPVGPNFFGVSDGYFCMVRQGGSWGGGAFAIAAPSADNPNLTTVDPIDMTAIYAHPEQYYFHIALKQLDPQFAMTLGFHEGVQNGGYDRSVSWTFGNVPGDNGQLPYKSILLDGDWHEYEIPCTEFVVGDQMMYKNPFYDDAGIMVILLFPVDGVQFHIDAAFFYKKP